MYHRVKEKHDILLGGKYVAYIVFKKHHNRPSSRASYPAAKKSFANGLNYYKLFWIFFIGCILGVVVELLNCLYTLHTLESRSGVIYGPFNPVYGFGAVALTLALCWIPKKNLLVIFLVGAISGGVVEYLCSFIQELCFGTVSWNYGSQALNFNGRTSIKVCIYWGLLSILWIRMIYPLLSTLIEKIPNGIGKPLTIALTVFLVLDMAISGLAVYRQMERKNGIPANNSIAQFLDQHYPDERLKKLYPNMLPAFQQLFCFSDEFPE